MGDGCELGVKAARRNQEVAQDCGLAGRGPNGIKAIQQRQAAGRLLVLAIEHHHVPVGKRRRIVEVYDVVLRHHVQTIGASAVTLQQRAHISGRAKDGAPVAIWLRKSAAHGIGIDRLLKHAGSIHHNRWHCSRALALPVKSRVDHRRARG